MEATKDYQGFSKTISNTGNTVTERFKAFKAHAEDFVNSYKIGQTSEHGTLTAIDLQPADGPYWTVLLTWSNSSDGMGGSAPTGTSFRTYTKHFNL